MRHSWREKVQLSTVPPTAPMTYSSERTTILAKKLICARFDTSTPSGPPTPGRLATTPFVTPAQAFVAGAVKPHVPFLAREGPVRDRPVEGAGDAIVWTGEEPLREVIDLRYVRHVD